jgi:hypothetical protein
MSASWTGRCWKERRMKQSRPIDQVLTPRNEWEAEQAYKAKKGIQKEYYRNDILTTLEEQGLDATLAALEKIRRR